MAEYREYYLTKITFALSPIHDETTVTQLVNASSKIKARQAVLSKALEEYPKMKILEIKVYDTLIGD